MERKTVLIISDTTYDINKIIGIVIEFIGDNSITIHTHIINIIIFIK